LFLVSSDGLYSFTLGTQSLAKWTLESDSTPVLTYTFGSTTVAISMICSLNLQDEFEVLGEYPLNYYSMRLRSRCACWNECKIPITSTTTARTFLSIFKTNQIKSIFFSSII